MYCILICYVLIIHKTYSSLAQREPISIIEEYLRRKGETSTNFDYNFSGVLTSDEVTNQGQPQGQPVKSVTHNFAKDEHDKSLDDGNRETPVAINRENNSDTHEGVPKKLYEDVTVENEAQEKELDEVLDDEEPVVLSVDKSESQIENSPELTNYKPDLHAHYGLSLRMHDSPESQTQDKHKLPVHEFLLKQTLNIPELGLHETPLPKAQSSPINKKGLKEDKEGNNGKKKSIFENTKHTMNGEAHDDATVTTKKSHHIPKPSTPLHKLENAFQNNLEYDLKDAAEGKFTNKSIENVQKHETSKEAKKDTDDDTQLINFKDIYTSSDNDKDGMLISTFNKPIMSFKDNSISNQRISDRFKNIYHIDYKKKTTAKGHDVILIPKPENTTIDEPVLTEYEEEDDKLKSYYNQGKLITGQTVEHIIDGKNIFLTYTNEYPIEGRRDLDDSVPESIEPNVGELVSDNTHIDNYDPVDGTIDGLGLVIIDKNITDNGTQAKKHHHHHHHNQHHHQHHENKTRQQPTGLPGNLPDLFFLDASQDENIIPD